MTDTQKDLLLDAFIKYSTPELYEPMLAALQLDPLKVHGIEDLTSEQRAFFEAMKAFWGLADPTTLEIPDDHYLAEICHVIGAMHEAKEQEPDGLLGRSPAVEAAAAETQ